MATQGESTDQRGGERAVAVASTPWREVATPATNKRALFAAMQFSFVELSFQDGQRHGLCLSAKQPLYPQKQ